MSIPVGARFGRLVGCASFWRKIPAYRRVVHLRPGHHDGVAGVRLVGQFYFLLSQIASIPAIYVAGWFVVAQFVAQYRAWVISLFVLLIVAAGIGAVTFVLPMRSFHSSMRISIQALASHLDERSTEVVDLREKILRADSGWQDAILRVRFIDDYSRLIGGLSSWPVHPSTRLYFSIRNVAFLIPFLQYLIGNANLLGKIADLVRQWGR